MDIITDERGTVISEIVSNSNRSDKDNDENENEERMIGGEDRLPNTLTHSLTLSQTPSLTANDNIVLLHLHLLMLQVYHLHTRHTYYARYLLLF